MKVESAGKINRQKDKVMEMQIHINESLVVKVKLGKSRGSKM